MSSFNRLPDPNGHDLLSNDQSVNMPLPNQDQSQESTGSSSFVAPPATRSLLPSDSPVGGHAQGERNIHRQYPTPTLGPAFYEQQPYRPRHHRNVSPSFPITGSLHQYDGTASIHSPACYPAPFKDTQHGSFDMSTRPLRANQASAMHRLSNFPVDRTPPRVSNMQDPMHVDIGRDRRGEEAFLPHQTGDVGVGAAHTYLTTHPYGHEHDRWHSAMMAMHGDDPAQMSNTAPRAPFGSSNAQNTHDFLHGQMNRTSNEMAYALAGNPEYAGQNDYQPYQQTARQPPLMTSPAFTGPTLSVHGANRSQHAGYGSTADGTYHPQRVVPNISVSQAPTSSDTLVEKRAPWISDLYPGNTNRRLSATTPQSSKKGSPRKNRKLRPQSEKQRKERAYKRRRVCGSCRHKKTKVSSYPPKAFAY